MAEPTKVFVTEEFAETNFADGAHQLGIFTPILTVTSYPPPGGSSDEQPNSVTFSAGYTALDVLEGAIFGNNLDGFPPPPIASPGLFLDGGLKIEDVLLDASGRFRMPGYDPDLGIVNPTRLLHEGDFRLDLFNEGDYAYLGYCRSDRRQFGYVQYAYISPTEWLLVGYAYGAVDEPVMVKNLIPEPGALGVLGVTLLRRGKRTDRK